MQKFYPVPVLQFARSGLKSGMVKLMLILLVFMQISLPGFAAEAQTINNTTISFTADNLTLKEVFKIIEEKSNFLIGYDNVIDTKKRVSLTVRTKSVYLILKQLLKDYKGNVTQVDASHVLIKVEKQETVAKPVVIKKAAVQVQISGTVTDTKGEPLPGVTVIDKSTGKKTGTDGNGKYSINVEAGSTLSFNYIGYEKSEILISGQTVVNVKLTESSNSLHEVVAIGYQKIRKADVTGAISSVKAAELNLSAPTVGQALVGKVAGVQVSQTSGAPYKGVKLRIRGTSSINASSDPLYVIDGFPAGNNIFINPEDIETIDILKDAASAAIYGSRGSGGVVMITTKKGKEGVGKFEYDVQMGISQLAKKITLLNSTQFAELVIDGRNNAYHDLAIAAGNVWNDSMYGDSNEARVALLKGSAGSVSIPTSIYNAATQSLIAPTVNTDWQDELYRNAAFMRHNLSFSGGAKDIKYYISSGYQNQDGIVENTSMKSVNFRANIDANVNKRMKVGAVLSYTQTNNKEVGEGRFSPMMSALLYIPFLPARDDAGNPIKYGQNALANQFGFQGIENPLASVAETKITRAGYRSSYNAYATYDILKDLVFKVNLGTQTYNEKYDYYLPTSLSSGGGNAPYSLASQTAANAVAKYSNQLDRLAEFTLNYNKVIGKHNFNVLGGYSAQVTNIDATEIGANGFTNDYVTEITARGAEAANFYLREAAKQSYSLLSYFGRFSYNYNSKYFLTGSLRTDGSSRFGPLNKWGTFPSVAAGWSLSQEDWYNDFLGDQSSVKIRASWGLSGNNNIGNYNTTQVLGSPTGVIFGPGGAISSGVAAGGIKDGTLGWESTSQYNFGTDVTVLKNRLSFTVNYYLSHTSDLLFNQPVSAISGSTVILTNLKNSKVQNKGLDFQLDGTIIKGDDFTFGASGNISFNTNKVLDLGTNNTIYSNGGERSYVTHITQAGQPVGMFYGFQALGRLTADNVGKVAQSVSSTNPAKIGDLYFQDTNNDGVVNDADKVVIGSPHAKFTYGFALTANYKAFDFRASFNGSYGNKVLDAQDYYLYNFEGSGNQYVEVADRYVSPSKPGSGLNYRASRGGTQSNNTRLSSFYIQDGSYFRMTNAMIGYNLPKTISQRLKVQNVRVFTSVDNAFTITKYKGYNPEVDYNNGSNLTPGVDYGNYPLARTYNLGLKVTF